MIKKMIVGSLLILTMLTGCSTTTEKNNLININDYIETNVVGSDGYVTLEFEINYREAFLDAKIDEKKTEEAATLLDSFDAFEMKVKNNGNLKNNDNVKVDCVPVKKVIDTLANITGKTIVCNDFEYLISNAMTVEEYDPFEDLIVNTNGSESGSGELSFAIEFKQKDGTMVNWKVSHDGENGKIKNGDTLTLTLDEEIDEYAFTASTGKKITHKEGKYVVNCLCVPISDEGIFKRISKSMKSCFDTVIEEWVVAGLSDNSADSNIKRTYENVGYVYYTNDTKETVNKTDDMFFAIYAINDFHLKDPYYTFIAQKGNMTVDHINTYVDGKAFSDSFVDYEKEVVRHDDEKWIEGEEMGFIDNYVPFAGHRTLDELISYINNKYGSNYNYKYFSADLEARKGE